MDRKQHWETVYQTKLPTEVSWYEPAPDLSLRLIEESAPGRGRVVDIGGGQSLLVDKLLDAQFEKVAVLDISSVALERSQARLGERAKNVTWIMADITAVENIGTFDVWHDRAVFHFLTEPEERRHYVRLAARTVHKGGHLVVGTFALDGPEKCSGLPVCRYDAALLAREFQPDFRLVRELPYTHRTPAAKSQSFLFAVWQRTSQPA
jgi:SAM-dependent methyltransferase